MKVTKSRISKVVTAVRMCRDRFEYVSDFLMVFGEELSHLCWSTNVDDLADWVKVSQTLFWMVHVKPN